MNRKAFTLIELSVLVIASFIIFFAGDSLLRSYVFYADRVNENNEVLLIMDSFKNKAIDDLKSGLLPSQIDADLYQDMIKETNYKVVLRPNEDDSKLIIYIAKSVLDSKQKVFTLEVSLDEK